MSSITIHGFTTFAKMEPNHWEIDRNGSVYTVQLGMSESTTELNKLLEAKVAAEMQIVSNIEVESSYYHKLTIEVDPKRKVNVKKNVEIYYSSIIEPSNTLKHYLEEGEYFVEELAGCDITYNATFDITFDGVRTRNRGSKERRRVYLTWDSMSIKAVTKIEVEKAYNLPFYLRMV